MDHRNNPYGGTPHDQQDFLDVAVRELSSRCWFRTAENTPS
jgi:hypothetical protein